MRQHIAQSQQPADRQLRRQYMAAQLDETQAETERLRQQIAIEKRLQREAKHSLRRGESFRSMFILRALASDLYRPMLF